MRRAWGLLLAVVSVAWMTGVVPTPAQAASPTVVSITFDDTFADSTPGLDAMLARSIPGTLFVNSDRIGNSNFMTRAQLKNYATAGFEIGGHTLGHVDLTTLTPADAQANICTDRQNLINLGYQPTNFAYPFGSTNADVQAAVRACGYNSARGISDLKSPTSCSRCSVAESIPPVNPYYIRTPASVRAAFTLADVEGMVTQAEDGGGGWVPIVFHHLCDKTVTGSCSGNAMDRNDFVAFLDWLKARPSTTQVKTISSVIGGPFNPVPNQGSDPVPDADAIIVGTKQLALTGTNVARTSNALILYTHQFGATTKTNAYGTEVTVVNGTATKVENGIGSAAIPAGDAETNFVVSGHGTAATWLKSNVKVGTTVTLHDVNAPPPPPPPPPPGHPSTSVTIAGQTHAVDGVDATRLANQLIVYTPDFGTSTGTNAYGFEAAVVDGTITQVADGVGDMAIPANGYVLSGHGTSRTYLKSVAKVGVAVTGQ